MTQSNPPVPERICPLSNAVRVDSHKILNPDSLALYGGVRADAPVLVILVAGKGTRFGQNPKCIQPVQGIPLARHSIDAFRWVSPSPVISLVGYRHEEVAAVLGADNIHVLSENPTGGTAFAVFEAFSVPALLQTDPLLIITMGDRIVPTSIFRRLWETHRAGHREADLTFLSAQYEPPKHRGKGRVLRGENGQVLRIIEERDIAREDNPLARQALLNLTEGNCPLYAIRASTLHRHLLPLTNDNAQRQYYLTDVVEGISREKGEIRTVTTTAADPEYDLLCSDVTQPMDLALLKASWTGPRLFQRGPRGEMTRQAITRDRPKGQIASIAGQLEELVSPTSRRARLQTRLACGDRSGAGDCGSRSCTRIWSVFGPLADADRRG
jgi:hypothetical protein